MPGGDSCPKGEELTLAWKTAAELLQRTLPSRWLHTVGVYRQAMTIGPSVAGDDAHLLAQSAILHDVGYSPGIAHTGFHPLDGARYLRAIGADERVVQLVAHHSCAVLEADERGLAEELVGEFPPGPPHLADALIFCDMTTSPNGQQVTVATRIAEVTHRYGNDSIVGRFIRRADSHLCAATHRICCSVNNPKLPPFTQ